MVFAEWSGRYFYSDIEGDISMTDQLYISSLYRCPLVVINNAVTILCGVVIDLFTWYCGQAPGSANGRVIIVSNIVV